MPNSRLLSLLVFGVAFALGVASCSQGTQEGEGGSLSLQLTIAGDVEIDEVAWVITRVGMDPMGGTINTSAPGSTASIEVFGLLPSVGQDYTITMEATDGETTCWGSEDFGIDVGEVTEVHVMLNCKRPERFGSVRVDGWFNICAELTKVVVSPLQTSVGNDIDLFSAAEDLDDDDIHYLWIGTGGSFDDAEAASTTYTCTDAGDHFVKITVTDEPDSEVCDSSWTVEVRCVECTLAPECDDGMQCTLNNCIAGVCITADADLGKSCDEGGGTVCDGDGNCVECSDDEGCDSGAICVDNECVSDDPNVLCDVGLCAESELLRQECVDEINACLVLLDIQREECILVALLTCNPE
jgi:hypothetical protein